MVKYVYTLSDVGAMFNWTFLSIKSLEKWVDVSDIIVFYTPPRNKDHIETLEDLGVQVEVVNNRTDSFQAFESGSERHYGEKTWVSEVDAEDVVFLDCDTLIFGDITEVLEGEFDVKARPGTSEVVEDEWKKMFERFGESYIDWMPNAGFLVFKNGVHKELGDKWMKYLHTELGYEQEANHKEQYALALSIGSLNVVEMSQSEHVMLWNNEYPTEGIVVHAGKSLDESVVESDSSGNRFADVFCTLSGGLPF